MLAKFGAEIRDKDLVEQEGHSAGYVERILSSQKHHGNCQGVVDQDSRAVASGLEL